MDPEKAPAQSINVLENTWTKVDSDGSPNLLVSSVEPCIIFCAYFPDQTTYFGHFTLLGDNVNLTVANYQVLGTDPDSMADEIEEKLKAGELMVEGAQLYVYGGGEVTFEDKGYNALVRRNFEHVADLANSLMLNDANKHIDPLPINTNMFFSINPLSGETVIETQPSRE